MAYGDGGGYGAPGDIHHGNVLRALIGDVSGAPIRADGDPMGVGAYPDGLAHHVARRVKEFEGPWSLADDQSRAAVGERQHVVR